MNRQKELFAIDAFGSRDEFGKTIADRRNAFLYFSWRLYAEETEAHVKVHQVNSLPIFVHT